jgi:DNA-binding MarR family transcriptional regulator
MNGSMDDGTRRPEAPPWESPGVSFAGREGFADLKRTGAALGSQAPRYDVKSSRARVDPHSGLTRRGVIYEYIRAHPGVHVRGVAKELRLATGDMQYHLVWLERHGLVKTRKGGFYRFVFPTMVFKEEQEVLLGVLSQETPREILLCLLQDAAITQSGLARSLGHSQPTISWHVDRLMKLGIVSKKKMSMGTGYEVIADHDDILRFVRSYHPEVWKTWAGRFSSMVVSAGGERVDKVGSLERAGLMPPAVVELVGKR